MGSKLRGRITYANVMSTACAVAVVSGGAFAVGAIPGSSGTITACYSKRTGAVRLIDADKKKRCLKSERKVTWNQKGVPNPNADTLDNLDSAQFVQKGKPGSFAPEGDSDVALAVRGRISSDRWQTLIEGSENGPLPRSTPEFTTHGGTVRITLSGSGYRTTEGEGSFEANLVDAATDTPLGDGHWLTGLYFNSTNTNSHTTLPTLMRDFTLIPAGRYYLTISSSGRLVTDGADVFTLRLEELPY